ncbi:hypothetical protein [Flindersiella endophytica]
MNGISTQINAAVLHGLGQVPRYESFPAPEAGDGEAVVTVSAAALKPSDRLMEAGAHYAPTAFPQVVGLDGVGRLADGSRVAFFLPRPPYGGMAEQTLARDGAWLPVPPDVDDVTAAAVLNPGGVAWKTVVWEGELEAGQSVLVLGATGTSGRIAAQLAARQGARVVVAGRNARVLNHLVARGGGLAGLPALALRRAPIELIGSGFRGPAGIEAATEGFHGVLELITNGELELDIEPVPLADVEKVWPTATADRRIVFVP